MVREPAKTTPPARSHHDTNYLGVLKESQANNESAQHVANLTTLREFPLRLAWKRNTQYT